MDPIVIIGTGLAGYSTGRELRKHDQTTPLVLVTQDDGESYYKPDLSEAHTKQNEAADLIKKDASAMAEDLNAEVITCSSVGSIDRDEKALMFANTEIRYSKLVLACGASPITPPLEGDAGDYVHQLNNLADFRKFRQSIAGAAHVSIIGAGLIGCEFANDLVGAGYGVSVIDPAGWPLSRLVPESCGKALQQELAQAGVDWHIGEAASRVDRKADRLCVTLGSGQSMDTDIVLMAVGLRPETTLASNAGLEINHGIVVDRTLATNDDHIYAIGDCAEVDGLWNPYVAPLMQCARTLGKNLTTGAEAAPTVVRYSTLPIIVKTHLCPVIAYPPRHTEGDWIIEGDTPDLEARFNDSQGNMCGFVLVGQATKKRREYLSQSPALMD